MTISAREAAKKICELGGWNVTNLQLQKVLYLAHMMFMGKNNGNPLIYEDFEAWDYGPVVPSLYREVKGYGAAPIRTGFYNVSTIEETEESKELEEACAFLLSKSAARLVSFTHRKGGAWDKNYRAGIKGIVIPRSDIIQEYRDIAQ